MLDVQSFLSSFTAKQTQLLDAADALINQGVSLPMGYAAIASRANLRLSNCYRHFGCERDLITALMMRHLALNFSKVEESLHTDFADWQDLLLARLKEMQQRANDEPKVAALLFSPAILGFAQGGVYLGSDINRFVGQLAYYGFSRNFDLTDIDPEIFVRLTVIGWPHWAYYFGKDGFVSDTAIADIHLHEVSYLSCYIPLKLPRRQLEEA